MSKRERYSYRAEERATKMANTAITAPLRISSWRLKAIAILTLMVGLIAALVWIYFKYSSPWFTADEALESVHIPSEIISSGGGEGGSVPFHSAIEAAEEVLGLAKTAGPVMAFVIGLFMAVLSRSILPLLGSMLFGAAMFMAINIVTAGHVSGLDPRRALVKSATDLEFEATRARLNELRVPASQRDYILGQIGLLEARKTQAKPLDSKLTEMIERAGYGYVNSGESGMSWSVLYKMEREAFGEVRSDTAKAYAEKVRGMQTFLSPVLWAAGGGASFCMLAAMLMGLLAHHMRRRVKRIEGLFRDVRTLRDQFAKAGGLSH